MVIAVSGDVAAKGRRSGTTSHGEKRWYTDYIGKLVKSVEDSPHSHLTEMDANQTIHPHFHEVNQFQIMVAGAGKIGRNDLSIIGLHYADHHTAYGPVCAGPYGLSLFTIRAQSDPHAYFLDQPGYKNFLKPSKKRYLIAENIPLSTQAALQNRAVIALENVLENDVDVSDGLGAFMLRMGGDKQTPGPDPQFTGGQHYLVLNGSLQLGSASYPAWSTVFVHRTDAPLNVCAGPQGLEALVLNFPRLEDEWLRTFCNKDV